MKNLNQDLIIAKLLQQSVIQAVSTKQLGNMSFDREQQQGQAEKNLSNFLRLLKLDLAKISLAVLPTNNTSNIAIINQPARKGRLILDVQGPEIKELFISDPKTGFDACITQAPETFLAILPADCSPVMLHDPITGFISLIHAGRQGVANFIIYKTVNCLKNQCGVNPNNLYSYIGPTICHKCYKPDGQSFDLITSIINQLIFAQVNPHRIELSPFCTAHHNKLFFSNFRAKGSKKEGRQIAVLGLK